MELKDGSNHYDRKICLEPVVLNKDEYSDCTWNIMKSLFGISQMTGVTKIKLNIVSVESWTN